MPVVFENAGRLRTGIAPSQDTAIVIDESEQIKLELFMKRLSSLSCRVNKDQ